MLDTHTHADHESARTLIYTKLQLKDSAIDQLGWNSPNAVLNFNSDFGKLKKLKPQGIHQIVFVTFY